MQFHSRLLGLAVTRKCPTDTQLFFAHAKCVVHILETICVHKEKPFQYQTEFPEQFRFSHIAKGKQT